MPKCPFCKRKIMKLECYKYTITESYFYLDEDGNSILDDEEVVDVIEKAFCPECGEELFENFEDAVAFLTSR
ncbi:MAG: hypothetical protein QXT92_00060 [Nitrososphaerota archaeon]